MDRIYLINSWPFLLRHLRLTIQSLQNTALEPDQDPSRVQRFCFQLDVSEQFRTVLTMRKHIDATSLALAQMYQSQPMLTLQSFPCWWMYLMLSAVVKILFRMMTFSHFSANTQPTDKGPSLLSKIEVALSNENLSVEVVSLCLLCLKESG
ncbi:hypothetical protein cypCar_00027841 [Cyprinus carpio]|nr:hypothetical protein cypCar_00027841 [Cyprinus carpio]